MSNTENQPALNLTCTVAMAREATITPEDMERIARHAVKSEAKSLNTLGYRVQYKGWSLAVSFSMESVQLRAHFNVIDKRTDLIVRGDWLGIAVA